MISRESLSNVLKEVEVLPRLKRRMQKDGALHEYSRDGGMENNKKENTK